MKLIKRLWRKASPGPDWIPALGSAVRLRSGGPAMLVCCPQGLHDKRVLCIWVLQAGGFESAYFEPVTLDLIG